MLESSCWPTVIDRRRWRRCWRQRQRQRRVLLLVLLLLLGSLRTITDRSRWRAHTRRHQRPLRASKRRLYSIRFGLFLFVILFIIFFFCFLPWLGFFLLLFLSFSLQFLNDGTIQICRQLRFLLLSMIVTHHNSIAGNPQEEQEFCFSFEKGRIKLTKKQKPMKWFDFEIISFSAVHFKFTDTRFS